jgi:hypothetical protein
MWRNASACSRNNAALVSAKLRRNRVLDRVLRKSDAKYSIDATDKWPPVSSRGLPCDFCLASIATAPLALLDAFALAKVGVAETESVPEMELTSFAGLMLFGLARPPISISLPHGDGNERH